MAAVESEIGCERALVCAGHEGIRTAPRRMGVCPAGALRSSEPRGERWGCADVSREKSTGVTAEGHAAPGGGMDVQQNARQSPGHAQGSSKQTSATLP